MSEEQADVSELEDLEEDYGPEEDDDENIEGQEEDEPPPPVKRTSNVIEIPKARSRGRVDQDSRELQSIIARKRAGEKRVPWRYIDADQFDGAIQAYGLDGWIILKQKSPVYVDLGQFHVKQAPTYADLMELAKRFWSGKPCEIEWELRNRHIVGKRAQGVFIFGENPEQMIAWAHRQMDANRVMRAMAAEGIPTTCFHHAPSAPQVQEDEPLQPRHKPPPPAPRQEEPALAATESSDPSESEAMMRELFTKLMETNERLSKELQQSQSQNLTLQQQVMTLAARIDAMSAQIASPPIPPQPAPAVASSATNQDLSPNLVKQLMEALLATQRAQAPIGPALPQEPKLTSTVKHLVKELRDMQEVVHTVKSFGDILSGTLGEPDDTPAPIVPSEAPSKRAPIEMVETPMFRQPINTATGEPLSMGHSLAFNLDHILQGCGMITGAIAEARKDNLREEITEVLGKFKSEMDETHKLVKTSSDSVQKLCKSMSTAEPVPTPSEVEQDYGPAATDSPTSETPVSQEQIHVEKWGAGSLGSIASSF